MSDEDNFQQALKNTIAKRQKERKIRRFIQLFFIIFLRKNKDIRYLTLSQQESNQKRQLTNCLICSCFALYLCDSILRFFRIFSELIIVTWPSKLTVGSNLPDPISYPSFSCPIPIFIHRVSILR